MLDAIAAAIETRAQGRFSIESPEELFSEVSSNELNDCRIVRLRRNVPGAGARTMIVARVENHPKAIQAAMRFAANIRELLPEPEASDVYMILVIDQGTDDMAARIETDDRFCRKIVLRPGEDAYALLDRTFLAGTSSAGGTAGIADPFRVALSDLVETHPWVAGHLDAWRQLILSQEANSDIAQSLLATAREVRQ
ncbi:ABC-three component system middle component 1 [Stenotrophomonas rhizophila]|uniref:Uncharacterized protein n=1 Tax=Stenotrophomonas rhizophila TaxID=216778 RepID=A0AAW5PLL4_9GAMM|nr:ABC-three component system middle component 1 [Stenotrophomonas rhizophila]MCS4281582.1 hypothetical protein [Stenotrophomonas rhizophila]